MRHDLEEQEEQEEEEGEEGEEERSSFDLTLYTNMYFRYLHTMNVHN